MTPLYGGAFPQFAIEDAVRSNAKTLPPLALARSRAQDLVEDANIDCSTEGLSIQAMDSSHVSLCAVALRSDGFDHFRCDRNISLGFNSGNLGKILKCADNTVSLFLFFCHRVCVCVRVARLLCSYCFDRRPIHLYPPFPLSHAHAHNTHCTLKDVITLKAEDTADNLTLMFESQSNDRVSDFELKLMDIDSDHLGIPETEYKTTVQMPSAEFQRIIRDLQVLGDTITIAVNKDGIRFSVSGDMGTGNVLLHSTTGVDKDDDNAVTIDMEEPVELTFALRYLNFFTKATGLGPTVVISMSPDVPVVVEYPIEQIGHIKYYLAPKIEEDAE